MTKAKILIVEDDAEIARLTAMYLQAEQYQPQIVDNGADALTAIKSFDPDMVVLDLMLPGLSGIEVCQQARTFYQKPIMVMTACDDEFSEISLLKMGADDYLTKPVKPHVMAARIEALLRRWHPVNVDSINCGKVVIHPRQQRVQFDGNPIDLTESEYRMLLLLAEHTGQVVTREACCKALRGINYDGHDRSVDMRISGLRKKLNDDRAPYKMILTVRNRGYMLVHD
ncbi:response regulator transcription factor [Ferrimonas kyonanensis]|uniref:response regulator transcription factor n=1 Tax=Ferrimonas kyonanensis TaxID=364763 RepID=UPI00042A6185|nr:response regulator transcription factor [Ferrimonas kyonanensis]